MQSIDRIFQETLKTQNQLQYLKNYNLESIYE